MADDSFEPASWEKREWLASSIAYLPDEVEKRGIFKGLFKGDQLVDNASKGKNVTMATWSCGENHLSLLLLQGSDVFRR